LVLHNPKSPAVPVVLYCCVVAQENPQVLLPHVATSISFPFLDVMLFAEFQWGVFGESPVIFFALLLGK